MFAEHSGAAIGSPYILSVTFARVGGVWCFWGVELLFCCSLITKAHIQKTLSLRRKTAVFFSVLTTIKLSDEQCSAKPVRDSTSEEPGKYKAGTLAEHGSRLRMLHGYPAHAHSPLSG